MNADHGGSAAAAPWADRARQAWAVALYDGKRLRRSRHALGTLVLFAVPLALMALIFVFRLAFGHDTLSRTVTLNGSSVTPEADLLLLARLFRILHLQVVTFVAAAVVFSNLYHSEIAERTLHHVFLMPVRRELVTIGKYVAGVVRVSIAAVASWWLSAAVLIASHGLAEGARALLGADGLAHLASSAATIVLAVTAYGALFLLVGSLFKAPSSGIAAWWLWEVAAVFLPVAFQRFTVSYWLLSLSRVSVAPTSTFATVVDRPSPMLAVPILLAFAAACVAAAAWRARHIQISYGASE